MWTLVMWARRLVVLVLLVDAWHGAQRSVFGLLLYVVVSTELHGVYGAKAMMFTHGLAERVVALAYRVDALVDRVEKGRR
jgi:hypothetical protein